jgi:hypothetical protein
VSEKRYIRHLKVVNMNVITFGDPGEGKQVLLSEAEARFNGVSLENFFRSQEFLRRKVNVQ